MPIFFSKNCSHTIVNYIQLFLFDGILKFNNIDKFYNETSDLTFTEPKIKNILKRFLFISLFFVFGLMAIHHTTAHAQYNARQTTRILFVFDASQSMVGRWTTGTKMQVAVRLLNDLVDSLQKRTDVELALRMYGHQSYVPPQDCGDTKLEVPFGKYNHTRIKDRLKNAQPRGTTPIAYSLEQAANDFPLGDNTRNIIILITDGIEECKGDPCAISKALQSRGIIIKPFVIGVGLDDYAKNSLRCIGTFYNANTEESFQDIIKIVISQALNPTSVQVNLLDKDKKPTETNVPMTFYDAQTNAIVYNFIHTMNASGRPDTLFLDNFIKYRIKVHTIPPVVKDNIEITAGKHNTIAIDAPQGNLHLAIKGNDQYRGLRCIVRKAGTMETMHIQYFGGIEKYLVGTYDIEILTLPRIIKKGIKIDQSTTTKVEIEEAGMAIFSAASTGYGAIFKLSGTDQEFVCNMNDNSMQQTIILQPGTYKAVYRYRTSTETILTKERVFTIKSGASTMVSFLN